MSVRNAGGESVDQGLTRIPDAPNAPTIGTVTDVGTARAYNNGAVNVAFTGAGYYDSTFTATSTPGSLTATGSSSPVTVTGLSSQTAYTFTVKSNNVNGVSSALSSSSSSVTATTVPQAPTIGTFTDGGNGSTGTLSFTAGATGGKNITDYKWSTDNVTFTALGSTTSPLTVGGLTAGTYTFYLKAVNANGDSAASTGVSGTVIQPTVFESIATVTGNGTVNTYTFSSIPSTYKHLQLRCNAIFSSATGSSILIRLNGDTATNYSIHDLQGGGVAASAAGYASQTSSYLTSVQQNGIITYPNTAIADILDYGSTSKYKTIRSFYGADQNASGGQVGLTSGLWISTAAVTSITVFTSPNFGTGTSIALYGIKG